MTRGKYGYTDPSGRVREYSYAMGVRCDQASTFTQILVRGSGKISIQWVQELIRQVHLHRSLREGQEYFYAMGVRRDQASTFTQIPSGGSGNIPNQESTFINILVGGSGKISIQYVKDVIRQVHLHRF